MTTKHDPFDSLALGDRLALRTKKKYNFFADSLEDLERSETIGLFKQSGSLGSLLRNSFHLGGRGGGD